MRWYEILALILIGALIGGAYLLSTEVVATRLFSSGIDRVYHDTYYVVAHRHYMLTLTFILAGGAAVFALILLWGRNRIRQIASVTISVWGLAVAMSVLPQHFVPLRGMPRRYIGETEVTVWSTISNAANVIALIAALVMLVLLVVALVQRLRRPRSATRST